MGGDFSSLIRVRKNIDQCDEDVVEGAIAQAWHTKFQQSSCTDKSIAPSLKNETKHVHDPSYNYVCPYDEDYQIEKKLGW